MKPPSRKLKPFVFFDDQVAIAKVSHAKTIKKIDPRPPKTVPASNPPAPEIKQLEGQQPTNFTPPVQVAFESFKVNIEERTPFSLVMKLLGEESLEAIVAATNAYAAANVAPTQRWART